MNCKICLSESKLLFKANVLNKYEVGYYQCINCRFIQTDDPYWLNEAYSSAIADLDVGLVARNLEFASAIEPILNEYFPLDLKALDYGGGYGLFVRMMRDKGFEFFRYDIYCQNLFAKYFDKENLDPNTKFDLVTSFEVFEHLVNPLEEINKMFTYGDNIFFSTVLVPSRNFTHQNDWWYFIPDTGQHVAFYSKEALQAIAGKFKVHFYTNGTNLHLFSKRKLARDPFKKKNLFVKLKSKFVAERKRKPLTEQDFNKIKGMLVK